MTRKITTCPYPDHMLFDLRGRGRRRSVQAIYLTLALLMGGGLIFFGIGGNTSGGLVDGVLGGGNGSGSADQTFEKRVEDLQKRTEVNPRDAAAWAGLAKARFQVAGAGENYDATTGAFTEKGIAELRRAEVAWDRYVALKPARIDPTLASTMAQVFVPLAEYGKAVQAQEAVLENATDPTAQQYAQLAVYAHAAKQDRKSTLAATKAVELAPTKADGETIKAQIESAKTQLDQAAAVEQPQSN